MQELDQIVVELHECAREAEGLVLLSLGKRLRDIADEVSDEQKKNSLLNTVLTSVAVAGLWASRLDRQTETVDE